MATRVRRLANGAFAVSLIVSPEVMRFAMRRGQLEGYFGPADYLNGILNTAMLREMEHEPVSTPTRAPRRPTVERSKPARIVRSTRRG